MAHTQTDLVVQISAAEPDSPTAPKRSGTIADCRLIAELRRCLQPGAEIALVFEGYMAITSILWLSELQPDGSVRAGVRLLGVSALPGKPRETLPGWNDSSYKTDPEQLGSAIIRQHL